MPRPRFSLRFLFIAVTIAAVAIGLWRICYSKRPITERDAQAIEVGMNELRVQLLLGAPHQVYRGSLVTWAYDVQNRSEYLNLVFDEAGRVAKIHERRYSPLIVQAALIE